MTELRFDDRMVIVTGAGRGVGRSHALLLASRGARVVVADYGVDLDGGGPSSAPAEAVVREITDAGGQAVACCAPVAEESAAGQVVEIALENFGRIDAVIDNAGTHNPGLFSDLTADQVFAMLGVFRS